VTNVSHIPSNKDYYDARFGALSQDLNEEEKRRLQVIQGAVEKLKSDKPLHIADFGCGRGWLSKALHAYGSVTGFDLSEKAIANARSSFPDIQFEQLNAEEVVPETYQNQFDLLVSSEVLEHTLDQKGYLQNCASLLKPGGHLILSTPNGRWKKDFYADGREQWQQPIENWRTAEELKVLMEELNWSGLKITSFNSERHFDFRPRTAGTRHLSHPLSRKFFKLTRQYENLLTQLNAAGYGLNLLIIAQKK
jgi:cyclopropane fatty-acyl-phospholipid synthase-like methyltransferase